MRNIKKLAVSVCFCSFAIQLNSASFDFDGSSDADFKIPDKSVAETPDCSYSGVYEFPIELCSPKMRPSERAETCQVPDDVLKKMSTKDLLETVVNYPFYLTGILSANNIQQGSENVAKYFKGLKELVERADVGAELIKKYQDADLACFADSSKNVEDDYIFKFYYLEILLAQDKIMVGLDEAQKAELKKEILRKYAIKQSMKECYGGGLDREVMGLLEKYWTTEDSYRPTAAIVYTPNNSPVEALLFTQEEEWTREQMRRCNSLYATQYPEAVKEADCSKLYNCHSYAWHSQILPNYIWINDPSVYWEDGSYIELSSDVTPSVGMNVFYNNTDSSRWHSAVFASTKSSSAVTGCCRSKWGQGTLLSHKCDYVPPEYDLTDMRVYVRVPAPLVKK